MVSQIVWLGVKDVFTQIAKDVIGQGLDHGRRSLRRLIQNQCGVSCGTIACSDVTEGNETQKPVSRMVLRKTSYVYFQKFLRKTWSDCTKDFSCK
ncbi:hypothetical protein YC2023_050822 [Brassica napus]